jgi:hypothetical protein
MKQLLFLSFTIAIFSCKQITKEDVETRLKTTMRDYLYEKINNDSSKVKYDVQSVIYYAEKDYYHCEFNVRMKTANTDTVGLMIADVKGDFKEVRRIQ